VTEISLSLQFLEYAFLEYAFLESPFLESPSSFLVSFLARFSVLVKILDVKEGVVTGAGMLLVFSESEFLLDKFGVSPLRRLRDGVSVRVLVTNPDAAVVDTGVEAGFTAVGVEMLDSDGREQLNIFRSRVGVAGIEGSVLFVVKLVCLETAGVPL
jgi:hypothetical protein